jgi:hypothetical protein
MLQRMRQAGTSRLALAGLVLAGLLLASFMSASPDLHRRVHHDADDEQHECLVTLMHNGGCGDGAPIVDFVVKGPLEMNVAFSELAVVALDSSLLRGSISERGPPVLS